MPRYISIEGNAYGIWSNETGTVVGNAVPATLKTATVNAKIAQSQSEHKEQAERKK